MKWINKNLYIKPINTHIDPYRPVENAIITHGHADHAKPGHKNVLATRETIEIMKIRYGKNCAENFKILQLNKMLKVDDVSITFYPAGHILGSVQVLTEFKGEKINFTGDYKTTKDQTCKNFIPVKCHTLVTEATFGLPVFQHPDEITEIKKLLYSLKLFPERNIISAEPTVSPMFKLERSKEPASDIKTEFRMSVSPASWLTSILKSDN